jgi:beta-N-acetylhexosaminidase
VSEEDSAGAAVAGSVLLGVFRGEQAPAPVLAALRDGHLAGVALYRTLNARDPVQVAALTAELRAACVDGGRLPPLICTDQEGGQLVGLPGTTPFPGNLALAAADDPGLTERVGRAIGTELAAMGVTLDWAPVCDLLSEPDNPAVGGRSFGDDPARAAAHAAAFVRGLRSARVGSSAKHFPGIGATVLDPHLGMASLEIDRGALFARELAPFRAAIDAGVDTVMAAHLRLPGIDPHGRSVLQSPVILDGLLRSELGFEGVVVTDALDMGAVDQANLDSGAVDAIRSGVDLLLPGPAHADPPDRIDRLRREIEDAARVDSALAERLARSAARVDELRRRLGGTARPSIELVGGAEHGELAREVATRAITLIRDDAGLLPLRPEPAVRVLVIVPKPADLTPADTSSFLSIELAQALRDRWPATFVDELIVPIDPGDADVTAARDRAGAADIVVLGTINAFAIDGQRRLAESVLAAAAKSVLVAMRLPHDARALPAAQTALATYGIEPPTIEALVDVLSGRAVPRGRVPVSFASS